MVKEPYSTLCGWRTDTTQWVYTMLTTIIVEAMIVEYNDQMSHYGVTQPIWTFLHSLWVWETSQKTCLVQTHCHSTWLYCANYHAHIIDISIIILHGYIVSFSPGDERRSSLANNYPLCWPSDYMSTFFEWMKQPNNGIKILDCDGAEYSWYTSLAPTIH